MFSAIEASILIVATGCRNQYKRLVTKYQKEFGIRKFMKIIELNQKTTMISHTHNLFTNCIILTFMGRGFFLHSVFVTL